MTRCETPRPFVFISAAMSLDGKISNAAKEQAEICVADDYTMRWEHRIETDAILIGANQLRLDDPKLTMKTPERHNARLAAGKPREPVKAAVVSDLATILKKDGSFFTTGERRILFTTQKTSPKEIAYFSKIAEVYVYGTQRVDVRQALEKLYELGVRKVLVEGGGELNYSLLNEGLVDEIRLKIGNIIWGGRNTVTLVEGDGFARGHEVEVKFKDVEKKENYFIITAVPPRQK